MFLRFCSGSKRLNRTGAVKAAMPVNIPPTGFQQKDIVKSAPLKGQTRPAIHGNQTAASQPPCSPAS